jgi:hypothetical protein
VRFSEWYLSFHYLHFLRFILLVHLYFPEFCFIFIVIIFENSLFMFYHNKFVQKFYFNNFVMGFLIIQPNSYSNLKYYVNENFLNSNFTIYLDCMNFINQLKMIVFTIHYFALILTLRFNSIRKDPEFNIQFELLLFLSC